MAMIVLPAAAVLRATTAARETMRPGANVLMFGGPRESFIANAEAAATLAQRVQGTDAMVALDPETVRMIERWLPSPKRD